MLSVLTRTSFKALPHQSATWKWYNSELRREPITPRYIRRRRREGETGGDHATAAADRQWGATICAARKRRETERECIWREGCCGNRAAALPTGKVVPFPVAANPDEPRQTDRHPFPEALLHLSMSFLMGRDGRSAADEAMKPFTNELFLI